MKSSRVQEVIKILKASVEGSTFDGKGAPKPPPRKSTKTAKKVKNPRKS
jgi:hypothetical protein